MSNGVTDAFVSTKAIFRDGGLSIDGPAGSRNTPLANRFYLYLMMPAIIVLACITIYPFFWLIFMSLHKVDIGLADDT